MLIIKALMYLIFFHYIVCMKTIITLLLFTGICYGQLSKGELFNEPNIISNTNALQFELAEHPNEDGNNYYVFSFRNGQYQQVNDFRNIGFYSTVEDLNVFYSELDKMIETGNKKTFQLGDTNLIATPKKKGLYLHFNGGNEAGSYTYVSKKNLDKLFGKK